MFRFFITLVVLTRAIYSMSTNGITTESVITEAPVPQTATSAPTLEDLANTLETLLAEHRDFKSALLGQATTSTKTPNNVQKCMGFLGKAARVSFKNMANTLAIIAFLGIWITEPEALFFSTRYHYRFHD